MIVIMTEKEHNSILSRSVKEEADVVIILKDERVAWIAKNRFGNQRELSVHNVPAFISSFMSVMGF